MKKLLTISALGISFCAGANASIISRSFLDEALTNYATSTALDLKADKTDLTALSDKIGTLPTTITAEGFYGDYTLPDNIGEQLSIIFYGNNDRVNYIPGLSELYQSILGLDTTGPANEIWDSLYNGLEKKLLDGAWREWRGLTEMDTNIKNNTAKIGTLPTEYTNIGDALTAIKGIAEEAKTMAAAAIPAPPENATDTKGKYVLTVDFTNGTPVYKWESIDRSTTENETTTE